MSVLENLKGRVSAKPQSPPAIVADVAQKLRAVESELVQLEQRAGNLALDALAGDADGKKSLGSLQQELTAAREHVSILRSAHVAAKVREEQEIAAQKASLRRTQTKAAIKALEARDAAAVELSDALKKAADAWHALLDQTAKAHSIFPIIGQWSDSFVGRGDIEQLFRGEVYRVSAAPGNKGERAMPGHKFPHTHLEWQPDAITPLAVQVKDASAKIVAKLTGKATG